MQRNRREDERLTEDEIARRKLGPHGVPGGEDSAKMTPQQEKNTTATLRSFNGPHGVDGTICRSRS